MYVRIRTYTCTCAYVHMVLWYNLQLFRIQRGMYYLFAICGIQCVAFCLHCTVQLKGNVALARKFCRVNSIT